MIFPTSPSLCLCGHHSNDKQSHPCNRREGESSHAVKSFPSQEFSILANAFKQLLNIWAVKELNVFGKCGERAHSPLTCMQDWLIEQGSFIPSLKSKTSITCLPHFRASPPSTGAHSAYIWPGHTVAQSPTASVGELFVIGNGAEPDPRGLDPTSAALRDESAVSRKELSEKNYQKIPNCRKIYLLHFLEHVRD